jgi:hypothetical protein
MSNSKVGPSTTMPTNKSKERKHFVAVGILVILSSWLAICSTCSFCFCDRRLGGCGEEGGDSDVPTTPSWTVATTTWEEGAVNTEGGAVNTEEGAVNTKGGAVNTEEGAVNTVCLGATAAVDNPISSDEGGDATIVTTTDVVVPELVFAIAYFRRDFRR